MEARVGAGIVLLVGLSLGAVLLVTLHVIVDRSLARAREDLQAAHVTFTRLLDARAQSATTLARLVTELPVFRAHMTDTRLRTDSSSIGAMADSYRRQLDAEFSIVTDARGTWLASPGWRGASHPSRLDAAISDATGGRPRHGVMVVDGRLFLVVSEPVRFADEVLGTFNLGYALDDGVARELAEATRCEVSLAGGPRVSGSSLDAAARTAVERWLATGRAAAPASRLWTLDGRRYVGGVFPLSTGAAGDGAGRLILFQSWHTTEQFLDGLEARFLAAGGIVFLFALLAGSLFSRKTSGPIREVAAAARDIAAGDWQRQVPVRGSAETVTLATAFNDMSASLRRAHDRLLHDAFHDPLTTLPNRALFMDRLHQAVARRARRDDYLFAVLFVDLDRFKTVNDSIGHAAGDEMLLETSRRLTAVLRAHDTVSRPTGPARDRSSHTTLARVGGDEFTLLLEDIRDPSDAVRIAERLQEAIAAPMALAGHTLFPSASIGIAVSSDGHRTGDDLIRDADLAMYRAKSAGGDRCAVFDTTMHKSAVERLQLEIDLRRAIERDELQLYYQPIVSLQDRRIVGFEALLRWAHPERGLLSPAAFLDVAEETGLVTRIDTWVLRRACSDARRWMPGTPDALPVTVSVNISAQGFGRPDLVSQVAAVLQEAGLPPSCLRLEITETVAMADAERARTVLAELKTLGVRISLDDFGTGYSSLSYLQRFPVDTLKIDRTFVAAMDQSDECREIIRTVLNLAMTLGLDVIAEGAETITQVEYLRTLRCSYGQGYYFSRPLPVERAVALPREWPDAA